MLVDTGLGLGSGPQSGGPQPGGPESGHPEPPTLGPGTLEPAALGRAAARAEASGYDGLWSAETGHDPFLPLVVAAEHTEGMELGTAIAVALARNPMTLAILGNDLQALSRGRFLLGLGSQVKAHVERRFSMPWSRPAARMRELVLAVRAIWDAWQDSTRLDFRGEFYTHTLMNPLFDPGPNPYGRPRILLAAVGPLMAEVAGEVADGILVHAFTTPRYLEEVTIPAVERGLTRRAGRREDFQVSYPGLVVSGTTDAGRAQADAMARAQIAFYGSTPAYRPVLELHGWGDLGAELSALSRQGRWGQMAGLIGDEVLDAFAVVATPEELPARILGRFATTVDRFTLPSIPGLDAARLAPILAELRGSVGDKRQQLAPISHRTIMEAPGG